MVALLEREYLQVFYDIDLNIGLTISRSPTDGVPITDLTIENVTGSVSDDATDVYILCAACTSWTWSGVDITGGESASCEGEPSGVSC
jgi:galacturan 1,4-alpha-galacturonidase